MAVHVESERSQRPARAPRPLVDDLVHCARCGDRARFDTLFDLWLAVVFAESARLTGDRRAAEHLTRELLVAVAQDAAKR